MNRIRVVSLASVAGLAAATVLVTGLPVRAGSTNLSSGRPDCSESPVCTEVADPQSAFGYYVGHDEPSVKFLSSTAGAGNSNLYRLTLPTDPPTLPVQDGSGGTFNFQLHPAFWFGMAMCDDQSAPNPGGSNLGPNHPCTADSDSNIFNNSNVTASDYIGLHPGTAFMEMQFYPPGWAPWPAGNSCDATKWCAALNIDSLAQNMNTGKVLNSTCASITGTEYVNFAFITTNGVAQAPASPVNATLTTFTPDPTKDLFMSSGDALTVNMHDTPGGFTVVINDLTSGQSGSMAASIANGFGEVQFAPAPSTACTNIPTNFHPAYATSSDSTRVPWAAHSYNIAFSDEIGHFEYCNGVNPHTGVCKAAGVSDASTGPDGDDFGCFSPAQSTRIRVAGCLGTDVDFDGVPYQSTWPGTFSNASQDTLFHPSSVLFTSPLANGTTTFPTVEFEDDLPRIEFATVPPCQRHISNPADPSPGTGCVNPPVGANFYPFFSTTTGGDTCTWNLGGRFIPGASYSYGTSSATQSGPLQVLFYPQNASKTTTEGPTFRYNDFNSGPLTNTC